LWYAAANVTSISGCAGGYQIAKVSECNRLGGDIVTMTGINFGIGSSAPPSVFIGGTLLDDVNQTSSSTIEVALPKGNRLDTAVLVLQSAGEVTTTSMTVDYHQCQPGQYELSYDCLPCAPGSAQSSQGQTLCNPCQPGYYANQTGQDACAECQGGTATTSGSYSATLSATTCLLCTGYFFQNLPRNLSSHLLFYFCWLITGHVRGLYS
jgi:hypothetical protein